MSILVVALPVPMRQCFDYYHLGEPPALGCRVRVPFGKRNLVGVVIAHATHSEFTSEQLKHTQAVLDHKPIFSSELLALCTWLATYYHHSLGMVLQSAMPTLLRKGQSAELSGQVCFQLTAKGQQAQSSNSLKRSPKQAALISSLLQQAETRDNIKNHFSAAVIKSAQDKGFIETFEKPPIESTWTFQHTIQSHLTASVPQALAISAIQKMCGHFGAGLLEGVTGSGKTEVYLQAIEPVLKQTKQVLILVPEIGLTPQTIDRFAQRFGLPMGILHSNLNERERLQVWQQAKHKQIAIVIGTRSAIFTPMPALGMIVVDEEHDASYKQQDGLRYHARDLAVVRAQQAKVPVILGSATPSLESLSNVQQGKYRHWLLQDRAGTASVPKINLFDLKDQPLVAGIATGLITRMQWHLQQGNQVLVFLNRRGYAPALICHQCAQIEQCHSCDRPFTLHKSLNKLHCHHCGRVKKIPQHCSLCGSQQLDAEGIGTEQLEQALSDQFPDYPPLRIDSDSTRGKNKLQDLLQQIRSLKHRLLVGTQIMAKGHHFPNVTLVVILGVDGGLFSADYRAQEKLAQLIVQLSGRAGRADKPGEIWLQTHDPGHPLLQDLVNNGYRHFAASALCERQHAQLPPAAYQALFRAEANQINTAHGFLASIAQQLSNQPSVQLFGPKPALMEKRQGRYRMQLVVQSAQRSLLQRVLAKNISVIEALPLANKVRWSLDVDPMDFV